YGLPAYCAVGVGGVGIWGEPTRIATGGVGSLRFPFLSTATRRYQYLSPGFTERLVNCRASPESGSPITTPRSASRPERKIRNCAVFSTGKAGAKLTRALPSAPLEPVMEGDSGIERSAIATCTEALTGPSALSKATARTRYSIFTSELRPR